jgi:hypothetical protein
MEECPYCMGTGFTMNGLCVHCDGTGELDDE